MYSLYFITLVICVICIFIDLFFTKVCHKNYKSILNFSFLGSLICLIILSFYCFGYMIYYLYVMRWFDSFITLLKWTWCCWLWLGYYILLMFFRNIKNKEK